MTHPYLVRMAAIPVHVGEEGQRTGNLNSRWVPQRGADAVCVVYIHLKS